MTKADLIAFENRVNDLWLSGELPYIFHLAGGNEEQLIEIFKTVAPGDYVLSTHRSHYHYLLAGGSEDDLFEMIRDGRSMFVFDKRINFLTTSVLGGMAGIAAGLALAIKLKGETRRVHCFLGDGACDNGHLYEAARYVDSMDLPCRFIVEDNARSGDSTSEQRGATAWILNAKCVERYHYTATLPHCQSPSKQKVTFKKH